MVQWIKGGNNPAKNRRRFQDQQMENGVDAGSEDEAWRGGPLV